MITAQSLVYVQLNSSAVFASPISSVGIANYVPIHSTKVADGDIIVAEPNGYYLSTKPYDPNIAGVVTQHPSIMIQTSTQGGYPIINTGTAYVLVSGINGSIRRGDVITTSPIPGVGMEANSPGYVLGQSLENVTFANKNEEKEITVSLDLHYAEIGTPSVNSIADILSISASAAEQQPVHVVQYIIAALIITLSFIFGFLIFIRSINTGITALGRNPLASRTIQLSILMNVGLVIMILVAGVALAYFMIRL